jgi:hypothetical protein
VSAELSHTKVTGGVIEDNTFPFRPLPEISRGHSISDNSPPARDKHGFAQAQALQVLIGWMHVDRALPLRQTLAGGECSSVGAAHAQLESQPLFPAYVPFSYTLAVERSET